MDNPVTALTELAVAVANGEQAAPQFQGGWSAGDPVIDRLAQIDFYPVQQTQAFGRALAELGRDPELAVFLPQEGQLDPFIASPAAGGSRVGFEGLVSSLITNAAKQIFIQQLEQTETALVRTVLDNYEELRRAARGEEVRTYQVRGLAGISLEPGAQIRTPWGTIRGIELEPVPVVLSAPRLQTNALLVTPQLTRLSISRESEPPISEVDATALELGQRIGTLTPLLFALSSVDTELFAPVITFETTIFPIIAGLSWSSSLPTNPFIPTREIAAAEIKPIEDLAHTLADNYDENLQLASFRTVQAIAHRADRSDALIDAVMAWESLVGTRSETVYRVTTALTRLLEPEVGKRRAFRKELQGIYDTRSRVVHGDVVEPQAIQTDSEEAIRISLRAMLELYRRGGEWLSMSSKERSESLILSDGQAA